MKKKFYIVVDAGAAMHLFLVLRWEVLARRGRPCLLELLNLKYLSTPFPATTNAVRGAGLPIKRCSERGDSRIADFWHAGGREVVRRREYESVRNLQIDDLGHTSGKILEKV